MPSISGEFIEQCIYRINENTAKLLACFEELSEEDIWKRPNESSNSIGNIILHLCGNIRQYAISSLGNKPDTRERDKEFAARDGYTKEELKTKLAATVSEAIETIKMTDENSLLQVRSVQDYTMTGIAIIIHVTEHYSYHIGQLIFWTKLLKNKGFSFYEGVDLNQKNRNS